MHTIEQSFDIGRGAPGLTEEFLYNNPGELPVISAESDTLSIFGHVFIQAVEDHVLHRPGVFVVRVGKAGTARYFVDLDECVATENVLYVRPKPGYRTQWDLRWLAMRLNALLPRHARGDLTGQRNISAEIINRVTLAKVDPGVQQEIARLLHSADSLRIALQGAVDYLTRNQPADPRPLTGQTVPLSKVVRFRPGNTGLTEEFIYHNQPTTEQDEIPILSSATLEANLMGAVSAQARPGGRKLRVLHGPCILVARNGKAGTMTYIDHGTFATNDHAYVVTPTADWKAKLNLRWFAHEFQQRFYNLVTSKSDNATFNKGTAGRQDVLIPDVGAQNAIAQRLHRIDQTRNTLALLVRQLDSLLALEVG